MLENYIAFIGSSFIITLAPGPDIIFSITQGMRYGKSAGLTTALGLACGNIVHTLLAIFGVALLIKTNPIAFKILKYFGVSYLAYLGVLSIKYRNELLTFSGNREKNNQNLFWRGFVMNVINPKVALFFVAFFPQFVNPKWGSIAFQMGILGFIFILLVILIFGTLSYYAGVVGEVLKRKPILSTYINVSAGIIFFALALKLLLLKSL
jgi:threonine/homoserine/homoserine lactone efflux protein